MLTSPRPNNATPTTYVSNAIAVIKGTMAAAMNHEVSRTKNSETDRLFDDPMIGGGIALIQWPAVRRVPARRWEFDAQGNFRFSDGFPFASEIVL